jgi:hypothetical protein
MEFHYSELILNFQEHLGVSKFLIDETFNKPDASDIVVNRCVSVKNFGEYYILVIFEMDGQVVRFLSGYRIYPKLLDGADLTKMKPLDILQEFMNRYGLSKQLPGFGEHKFFIERRLKLFFPGILDIDKYQEALKNI